MNGFDCKPITIRELPEHGLFWPGGMFTPGGRGVLPYISHIGMCGPKGYGF